MADLSHTDAELIGGTLTITGTSDDDKIVTYGMDDKVNINAGNGNDIIYADDSDFVDGGSGVDTFVPKVPYWKGYIINHVNVQIGTGKGYSALGVGWSLQKDGGVMIYTSLGKNELQNVELVLAYGYTVAIEDIPSLSGPESKIIVNEVEITPNLYTGPVKYLDFSFIGSNKGENATGSNRNDFFNLKDGNDAAMGGIGDDVLDGGAGSNFLTGGEGNDTFFLDGRDGDVTWSTITDFDNEEVNIWGWNDGVSQLISSEDNAGADGFKGATLHYDLNNDGTIDTSITFSGLTLSEIPQSIASVIEGTGYLFFG